MNSKTWRKRMRETIHQLASLKLAVVIIIAIGVVTAWGTIVEAKLDAMAAKKLVYHSPWMLIPMVMLVICLTAVMIDRWPWQKRHTGFVLAHIGIIILLLGSLLTQKYGVDGSMTFGFGESSKRIVVGETDLAVHSSMDGSSFTNLFFREVDFFLHPADKSPIDVPLPSGSLKVVESLPYALREQKFVHAAADDVKAGAAIRFQMVNPNVNVTEWVLQAARGTVETKDFGPAKIIVATEFPRDFRGRNAMLIKPIDAERVAYQIHYAKTPTIKSGMMRAGDSIDTGWMGIQFRLLKYMEKGKEEITFRKIDQPTPISTSAIRVEYTAPGAKQPTSQWLSLNSVLKLFSDSQAYFVSYANRRVPLDFELRLKKFDIGRYQGTMRAASYQSLVEVTGDGPASEHLISMNEPLQHGGFTFYQASFESDPATGKPIASVLSVNRDPGRSLKYFGSLLIVLGTLHLFYLKRRAWTATGAKAG